MRISLLSTRNQNYLIAAGLAQSVDHLTAEREVTGSIPVAELRNEGTPCALQAARPSRGSDDHEKWRSRLQLET